MRKIYTILIAFFSLAFSYTGQAQEKNISGTVSAKSDGSALPGVSIVVEGTTRGTETDFDGKYTIKVSMGGILKFSFIGMKTKTITVGNSNTIDVVLEEDTDQLDEVVVTAFGVKKSRKTLTYAVQDVKGEDLTRVKQTNPINSLSGKTAGLTITRSSSGAGGATKVVLRGNSSATNNDPLYVIDGVPMPNNGNGQNGASGRGLYGDIATGNRDGGDIMSLINPDDIESITVLKGSSASALYGSQGANGVILITTKKGREGKITVNVNSSLTIDNVISLPKLQTEYQSLSVDQPIGANGRVTNPKSWGAKTSGLSNTVNDFFDMGITSIQSISLTAGSEIAQTYFSYANTIAKGVIPGNELNKNNFTFRETASILDNKIKISASINMSDQRIDNRPTSGLYSNLLTGLYLNPVGIDLNNYKHKFEYFNTENNIMDQYATSFDENIQQNPYWLIYRNPNEDKAQRLLLNLSAKYQITDNFSIQSRGSYDKSFFVFDKRLYAGTDIIPATGRYILEKTENTQQYIDIIGTYSKDLSEDFSLTAVVGTSLTKYKIGDQIFLDSGIGKGLTYPNIFTIANFAETKNIQQSVINKETQSLFGSINLGYKNMVYLDLTARQDWSSTTPDPFFYPSVGLTGILSEMFEMSENISFAKIRTSFAKVGKELPAYSTQLNFIPLRQNNFNKPTYAPRVGETLRPEEQTSFEIGTEWRFFQNRFGIDLTYYSSKTKDQIFFIQAEANTEGYQQNIVNAGEISNKGIELILTGKPVFTENFKWNTTINFATNENKVVSVHPEILNGEVIITPLGVNGYGFSLKEGEDFGSIIGRSIVRNKDGLPIVSTGGTIQSTDNKTIGHAQPDYTFGWNNSFEYKNLSVTFLIDAKVGGSVVSVTEAINDFYGVSQASADARNTNGGMINVVDANGKASQLTAKDYYTKIGGRAGLLGEYVYDATNINLREVSIAYKLPFKEGFVKNMRVSLIANNLLFIYKKAPFDPNIATSTGIGLQGVDVYGQPSIRSIGLNINFKL